MNRRVLVVEDDLAIADMIMEVLELEGFTVEHAVDGEALRLADQTPRPAVVLLDLMMPGMDGFEVARRLRANPTTQAIPIVAMSAGQQAREGAARMGANDYLAKPFDLDQLIIIVERQAGMAA